MFRDCSHMEGSFLVENNSPKYHEKETISTHYTDILSKKQMKLYSNNLFSKLYFTLKLSLNSP